MISQYLIIAIPFCTSPLQMDCNKLIVDPVANLDNLYVD